MTSNTFDQLFEETWRGRLDDENGTQNHQSPESPSVSSRILDRQREALLNQTERLCASDRAVTNDVLKGLGLPIQQEPLPSPQPPAGPRPDSCVQGWRIGPVNEEVTSRTQRHQRTLETQEELEEGYLSDCSSVDGHTPRELSAIPLIVTPSPPPQPRRRVLRLPVMNLRGADKEVAGGYKLQTAQVLIEEMQKTVEKLHLPRPPAPPRRIPEAFTPAPPPRLAPLKNKGTRQRTALKPALDIPKPQTAPQRNPEVESFTPGPPPRLAPLKNKGTRHETSLKPALDIPKPQTAPQRNPEVESFTPAPPPRLAPLKNKGTRHGTSLKPALDIPKPQTARQRNPEVESFTPAPPPRLAPLMNKGTHQRTSLNPALDIPKPQAAPQRNPEVESFTPAPPPRLVPLKDNGTRRGTSLKPAKAVNGGRKGSCSYNPQTADNNTLEELQPLYNPEEGLSLFFKLISSEDWEKKVEGLRIVQAVAQHHPDTLTVKLHQVCLAVEAEVKNLRSSVASAAMDTLVYLYVYLHKDMDNQAERTGNAVLQKIAQAKSNASLRQQANKALEAMVQNCSPGRVLNTLLNKGLNHLCPAVRVNAAWLLHLLADIMGVDVIFAAGSNFTQRFLVAVSKISLDAAADVRPHGHALLQELSTHRDFMKLWNNSITKTDQSLLERILRTANRM